MSIKENIVRIKKEIKTVSPDKNITLIAVSKTQTIAKLKQAINAGQKHFGENYLQEALAKINALKNYHLIWHFIGDIQANKTKEIAKNFAWVQSISRLKIAKRLNTARPENMAKLNICLQINIDNSPTKSGILRSEIDDFIFEVKKLKCLKLRGFMCIPDIGNSKKLFEKMAKIKKNYPTLNMLSMGTSADMITAIEAGSTMVRIGSDIFGVRL